MSMKNILNIFESSFFVCLFVFSFSVMCNSVFPESPCRSYRVSTTLLVGVLKFYRVFLERVEDSLS